MKIKLIAVGEKLPQWLQLGIDDFVQRFSHPWPIDLAVIAPAKRHKSSTTDVIKQDEWLRIKAHIPKQALLVAMDERGHMHHSQGWADLLDKSQLDYASICFVIGGADGLSQECRDLCHKTLALSPMTLPHGLARLVLIEQLYRAVSLIRSHPYHRD